MIITEKQPERSEDLTELDALRRELKEKADRKRKKKQKKTPEPTEQKQKL